MEKLFKKKKLSSNDLLNICSYSLCDDVVYDENNKEKKTLLKYCNFTSSLFEIPSNVFSGIKKMPDVINVPATVCNACDDAFKGCDLQYIYQTNGNNEKILSTQRLDLKNVRCCVSIASLQKVFPNLSAEKLIQVTDLDELITFAKKISSTKTILPFEFFLKLKEENMQNYFVKNSYFKFFNRELAPYIQNIFKASSQEQVAFYSFANALGCFSKEFMVDENSESTDALLCHKASNLLARLLQSETLIIGSFYYLFNQMPTDIIPNQDFYNFLASQSGKNNFVNAKLLIKNSIKNRDYFLRVMLHFDYAKGFKRTLNSEGQPVELSWEHALNLFYNSREYKGITNKNRQLAKIYEARGLKQKTFNEACDIFEEARLSCTPHHILGKPLKEENDGTKMFTYEFLDKFDPRNAILGLYCSCCATLASEYYGRDITVASVLASDVQNVVIRAKNGAIIAKGTLFVNSKKGYAVFNDFEVEYKYRSDCEWTWHDSSEDTSKQQMQRKLIFDTFMRAVKDFKVEYDKQHQETPLKKVAVGIGFNKLKDVCEEFVEKAQPILKVPKKYCFRDADNHQYLLLGKNIKRKSKKVKQEDDELNLSN